MKKVSFLLRMIQGAIGKKYVVKHYRYGVVVTSYPDMSRVKASEGQRACRDVFREAVAFAKAVFADAERKVAYERKLGRKKRLFQAVMQEYMENLRPIAIGREAIDVRGGASQSDKKAFADLVINRCFDRGRRNREAVREHAFQQDTLPVPGGLILKKRAAFSSASLGCRRKRKRCRFSLSKGSFCALQHFLSSSHDRKTET